MFLAHLISHPYFYYVVSAYSIVSFAMIANWFLLKKAYVKSIKK